ncbi:hypothetical protein K420107F6_18290 [Lactonifactor longoviformis]
MSVEKPAFCHKKYKMYIKTDKKAVNRGDSESIIKNAFLIESRGDKKY